MAEVEVEGRRGRRRGRNEREGMGGDGREWEWMDGWNKVKGGMGAKEKNVERGCKEIRQASRNQEDQLTRKKV